MKDGSSGVGIRLGRLRKTGLDGKGGSSSGGASGGSNSAYHETDLEKLRKSIQLLVQHTGTDSDELDVDIDIDIKIFCSPPRTEYIV